MSSLPTSREAVRIMKNVGCPKNVIKHCKTVSKLAVKIAKKIKKKGISVDIGLVKVGGLLHDIGRSKTNSVRHAFVGSEIAHSLELPDSVINIIERHIGSGIPAEEAKQLGLPERDFIPATLEEKIVSYADKLIVGDRVMDFDEAFKSFSMDLGSSHPAISRLKRLHNEFLAIIGDLPSW